MGLVLLFQTILVLIGFNGYFSAPGEYSTIQSHDGLKNYFTFLNYVCEPDQNGIDLHFGQMNYPYGENIFYTDNTPVLALATKFFGGPELSIESANAAYHGFFIFAIWLNALFLFLILKRIVRNPILLLTSSISLAWINPMILRLGNGHHNLSIALFLSMTLYVLIRCYEERLDKTKFLYFFLAVALVVFASFFHLYYFPIITLLLGGFFLSWLLNNWIKKENIGFPLFATIGSPVFVLAFVYGIIRFIDPFYAARSGGANGFNYDQWKVFFSSLYHPYEFNSLGLSFQEFPYESASYLGSFALTAFFFFLLLLLMRRKQLFQSLKVNDSVWPIFLIIPGFLGLSISLGTEYHVPALGKSVKVLSNPFFYLEKISDSVTHFRCMGRFVWIFWLSFNLLMLWMVDRFIISLKPLCSGIFVFILSALLLVDTYNFVGHIQSIKQHQVLLDTEWVPALNSNSYQAILPIPFYHVGSENYEYTLDPNDRFCAQSYQLSMATGLPLVASKLSRTSESQAIRQFNLFLDPTLSSLDDMSSEKPLLIMYSAGRLEELLNNPAFDKSKPIWKSLKKQKELIESGRLGSIIDINKLNLFSIYPADLRRD